MGKKAEYSVGGPRTIVVGRDTSRISWPSTPAVRCLDGHGWWYDVCVVWAASMVRGPAWSGGLHGRQNARIAPATFDQWLAGGVR